MKQQTRVVLLASLIATAAASLVIFAYLRSHSFATQLAKNVIDDIAGTK